MNRVSFLIFVCILSVLLSIVITVNIVYPTSDINLFGSTYNFTKYNDAIHVIYSDKWHNFTRLFELEPTLLSVRLDNVRIGCTSLLSIIGLVLFVTFLVIISARLNSGFFIFFENVLLCVIMIIAIVIGITILSKNNQLKSDSNYIQHNMTLQCFEADCNTYPGNYDIINKTSGSTKLYTLYYYADYSLFNTYNCKIIIYQRSYTNYDDAVDFAKSGYTLFGGSIIYFSKNETFKSAINCTKDIVINNHQNDATISMCPYGGNSIVSYDGFQKYYTNQKKIIINKMISTSLFVVSMTLGIYLIIKAIVYGVIFYRRLTGTY